MLIELYGWGANSHGQLGLEYQSEQVVHPEKINLSKIKKTARDIKCIVGGAGHTLILDQSGQLYGCGWNKKGQVGVSPELDVILSIQAINSLKTKKIINVVCGWDSSLALTENGKIYGWGSNHYNQLGIEKLYNGSVINEHTCNPTEIFIEVRVKCIAMGLRHSAVVSDDGRVFVTGSGNKGQLGLMDSNDKPILSVNTFTQVPGIENIIDVACGQYFTVALASNGDIFTWGNNKHGQLGIDNNEIMTSIVARKLENVFGEANKIFAGWTHTNLLNSDGVIFSWGRNTYGQSGRHYDDTNPQWQPKIVGYISNVRQLAVGSEHNVALNDKGEIYSWGWNEHGNCGNGNINNIFEPCNILNSNNNIGLLIGSGAGHSFAIVEKKMKNT